MTGQHLESVLAQTAMAAEGEELTTGQAQRITCLAVATQLCAGRNVQWATVMSTAQWLYSRAAEPAS